MFLGPEEVRVMTIAHRHVTETIITVLCLIATLAVVGMLFLIVGQVFIAGLPSLSWSFITTPENAAPGLGQGIANAIVGTILISLLATIVAAPFGFGTAIYMKRYAADNGVTRAFRFLLEVLSGTPSIVVGIFGFLIFVIYLKPITGGYSLIAGAVALAILIMPIIERAIEDAIDRVSPELEEGSYALGADKWQTIRGITIPTAFTGIMTGLTLGFARAAEESAVVLLTAGYTQYMPDFGIRTVNGVSGGVKLFPLQDQVGTLPVALYNDFKDASLVKPSAAFAAAFVLVVLVFTINIAGKAFLSYGFGSGKTNKGSFLNSVKNMFSPQKMMGAPAIGPAECLNDMPSKNKQKDVAKDPTPEKSSAAFTESIVPEPHSFVLESSDDAQWWSETDVTMPDLPEPDPENPPKPPKKTYSLGAGIKRLSHAIRQGINILVQKTGEKQVSGNTTTVHGTTDNPASVSAGKPDIHGRLSGSLRPFLLTLIPFIIVAAILEILSFVLPGLSTFGSNGPAGTLAIPIMAIVLCVIGVVFSLFLVRGSTIFLLRHKKTKIGNRRAEYAAIITGICLILIVAFLFSAHVLTPPERSAGSAASTETVTSGNSQTPGGGGFFSFFDLIFVPGQNLLGFLHPSGLNATGMTGATVTDSSNRSAKLAALIASGAYGDTGASSATPTPAPVSAASTPSAAQVTPVPKGTQPIVPVKYYLDVGESYWYGDDSRPCLATVYNVTELSHYYYWDFNWNRFAEVTPSSTGDTFLIVFIRIEDTGRMDAIVPAGDDFIVTNNGQTYTHNPFFDLSVLSQSQITHYSTDPQSVPYQWIREIGQQKRDYAFLTGYNIFGQNTTIVTNYTANSAASPPGASTGNGQGFFITPGSSNAIDGYLIYEVPDTVAADLRDTYMQVSFNSISPTRWRLGK